jgi:hypothetical protein
MTSRDPAGDGAVRVLRSSSAREPEPGQLDIAASVTVAFQLQ